MITWTRKQPGSARATRRGLRTLGCATLAALLLTPASGQAARPAAAPKVATDTPVVTLQSLKSVYAQPVLPGMAVISNLPDQRPLTLVLTTMPIIGHTKDAAGRDWLQVRLPGREMHEKKPPPTGWITADGTKVSTTPWHVVVSIATRSVHVYDKGRRVKTFKVVVGKPSTPTPRGEFFIEEGLRLPRKHVGYPYALATSARSRVFKEFMGGPGQIAFHGIVNIPGSKMGSATSNGCIRMTTPALMWMAKHIKAGTPLTVR
ncbi:MAG: hypothetical protein QOJ46_2328 [bacterium]|jgi:lipoprotein-anchoring transpeptidase ErfK/SrfK